MEWLVRWVAQNVFEMSAMWGVRWWVKRLLHSPTLRLIEGRVHVEVPAGHHMIMTGVADRAVAFFVTVDNPTRHVLQIERVHAQILYEDTRITPPESRHDEVEIGAEVRHQLLEVARYNPFASPVGIPHSASGWRLLGRLEVRSYFGLFTKDFESRGPLTVDHGDPWDEVRAHVTKRLTDMKGSVGE